MNERLAVPVVSASVQITIENVVAMERQVQMWVNMTNINSRVLADMVATCHPMLVVYLRRLIEANLVAQNNAMYALNQVNTLYKDILEAACEDKSVRM